MLFASRGCWPHEMGLVRNKLTEMYVPFRKKIVHSGQNFTYFYGKTIPTSDGESENLVFLNPQEVKKDSP